jgi:hypothetical protein
MYKKKEKKENKAKAGSLHDNQKQTTLSFAQKTVKDNITDQATMNEFDITKHGNSLFLVFDSLCGNLFLCVGYVLVKGELKYRTPDNVLHPATGVDSFGPFKCASEPRNFYRFNSFKKPTQDGGCRSVFDQDCDVGFGGKDGVETYKSVDFDI